MPPSSEAPVMPRIAGILESSLYVDDLDRARDFYRRVFGFETFIDEERMCAMGVPGGQVLLLFHRGFTDTPAPGPDGGFIPPHRGEGALHLCFAIPYRELAAWEAHLRRLEIPIESRLRWPSGGTSVYFRDLDNNSLEVATPGLWPNN
jgi:catechol 2,3-dioxygenase-like lactoylglutathione lyase family enzyme